LKSNKHFREAVGGEVYAIIMAAKRRKKQIKRKAKMAIYLQVDYKTGDLWSTLN
jgi:hypothetical protein